MIFSIIILALPILIIGFLAGLLAARVQESRRQLYAVDVAESMMRIPPETRELCSLTGDDYRSGVVDGVHCAIYGTNDWKDEAVKIREN